jgi:hypothetical protein
LTEETGVRVAEGDLIPFGCLSEAEAHTIHYPNGDVTHCFALLFVARAWQGDPRPSRATSRTDRPRARPVDCLWQVRRLPGPLTPRPDERLGSMAGRTICR